MKNLPQRLLKKIRKDLQIWQGTWFDSLDPSRIYHVIDELSSHCQTDRPVNADMMAANIIILCITSPNYPNRHQRKRPARHWQASL
jgi:hypothetical protein